MIIKTKTVDEALELAKKQAEEKAETLGDKVLYFLFLVDDKEVDGETEFDFADAYMNEPPRLAKLDAIDVMMQGRSSTAAEHLWLGSGLKDETDKRIESSDELYLGLMFEIMTMIKMKAPAIKKNSMS